jgi:D-3-phosphoglycerate dehydrogenase
MMLPVAGLRTDPPYNYWGLFIDQLIDFLEHGNITNSVNFPASYLERTSRFRLAVANRNIPGMLGKMMAVLAERNINISEMLNKSRQDVAYNLIDIETEPSPELVSALQEIGGISTVRVLNNH